MKSFKQPAFLPPRRVLCATGFLFLIGAAGAFAQSAGSSTATGNRTYNSGSTSTTGSSGTKSSSGGMIHDSSNMTSDASMPRTNTDKLSWSDRRFVNKTAEGNQDEVQLARLAAERTTNIEVRNFAQKIVSDHTSMASELTAIASAKNVKLDSDTDQTREYKRLSKKSGPDFDHEFVDHMIDEHENDIKAFEKAAKDAKDAEVRSFASKHLADLRQHLATAQNLEFAILPTGRTDADTKLTPTTGADNADGMSSGSSSSNANSNRTGTYPDSTPGVTPTP